MIEKSKNASGNNIFYSQLYLSKRINHNLFKKYSDFKYSYSLICTNNLISNEKCQIVARFKDFLIFDDLTEFLHEFCPKKNLISKLKYIFDFYTSYSRIYPNYIIIPENKFLYKNLRKKQKVIDENNALKLHVKNKNTNNKISLNKDIKTDNEEKIFFNKSIIDSINRLNISSNMNSTKKNSNNSYSNTFSNIVSSISSEIKKSRNSNNIPIKTYNLFYKQQKKNNNNSNKDNDLYDYNDNTLNTQSSSIKLNNFYDENTKSKASLTEIINLIDGKNNKRNNMKNNMINNNNKNVSYDIISKEKNDKVKIFNKNKIKFLMLDIDYIKKNFKTHKNKNKLYDYNNVKTENSKSKSKTHSIKKEDIDMNINKNIINNIHKSVIDHNHNHNPHMDIINLTNNDSKNKIVVCHKQTVSCIDEVCHIKKLKNKIQKRHQLGALSKLNFNKINNNVKTVSKFGIIHKRNKKNNEIKSNENLNNNCSNFKYKNKNKKNNIQVNKNLIFSNTISTNSTINFGYTFPKLNTVSNNLKYNIDYQNFNETKENYTKKKNKYKMMKSLETLMNIGNRRNKICKERELKKAFKFESDSIQLSTVPFNKKNKHKFSCTCTDKVLTQIKRTIKNIKSNKSQNLNNNTLSSYSKKFNTENSNKYLDLNFPIDKVISYGCKPFSEYYKNSKYFAKIKLKKQRTSTLIKNNIIFNFVTSKDFYNLKIKGMKSFQKQNFSKLMESNPAQLRETKKNKSMNKINEQIKINRDKKCRNINFFK